jgi:hypothetical protein
MCRCRTRKTTNNSTPFSLAQKMLPRELLQQLRMEPPKKLRSHKRKRLNTVQEEEEALCRTLRCVPDMGFLTTIQNMIDVARLSAYLSSVSFVFGVWSSTGHTM